VGAAARLVDGGINRGRPTWSSTFSWKCSSVMKEAVRRCRVGRSAFGDDEQALVSARADPKSAWNRRGGPRRRPCRASGAVHLLFDELIGVVARFA